jgi:hypothetical protein
LNTEGKLRGGSGEQLGRPGEIGIGYGVKAQLEQEIVAVKRLGSQGAARMPGYLLDEAGCRQKATFIKTVLRTALQNG